MPGQDYQGRVEPAGRPDTSEQPGLSRRIVLRRAAGFGAVGLAVAAGGGVAAAAVSSTSQPNSAQSQGGSAAAAAGPGPIVIYMADPGSGEMQIFAGTGQTRHTNHAIAATVASMAPR